MALEVKAERLLIDERLGRQEAIRLGIPITGVLGVLLAAKQEGWLPMIKPVIDALMAQAGFWIAESLYLDVLETAGESS